MEQRRATNEITESPDRDAHRLRNGMIWTAALLVLLLGVGLAIPDLRDVLERITDASPGWIVLAIGLEVASCLGYVATVRLVLRRGPAREVRWLGWAEQAFGAVVPVGGAGGLAVGAWAMRAWGIEWSRIVNRSAVIFLLTSAVNAAVLVLASFGITLGLGGGHAHNLIYTLLPGLCSLVGLIFALLLPRFRPHDSRSGAIASALRRSADWISDTEALAFTPDWRLIGTVGYLVFDIAMLWVCMRAVGINAPVFALVIGYQIGYLANLIPVPGGVGVLEGGLLGALLLYGFPAGPTAAAVVIYHAVALWVPTLGGIYGFARLRRVVAHRRPLQRARSSSGEVEIPAPRPQKRSQRPRFSEQPSAARQANGHAAAPPARAPRAPERDRDAQSGRGGPRSEVRDFAA